MDSDRRMSAAAPSAAHSDPQHSLLVQQQHRGGPRFLTTFLNSQDPIGQRAFMQAVMDEKAKASSLSVLCPAQALFYLHKPRERLSILKSRSLLLDFSDLQNDYMYALAGCSDVDFLQSRVSDEVRDAMTHVFGIERAKLGIWFKNRRPKEVAPEASAAAAVAAGGSPTQATAVHTFSSASRLAPSVKAGLQGVRLGFGGNQGPSSAAPSGFWASHASPPQLSSLHNNPAHRPAHHLIHRSAPILSNKRSFSSRADGESQDQQMEEREELPRQSSMQDEFTFHSELNLGQQQQQRQLQLQQLHTSAGNIAYDQGHFARRDSAFELTHIPPVGAIYNLPPPPTQYLGDIPKPSDITVKQRLCLSSDGRFSLTQNLCEQQQQQQQQRQQGMQAQAQAPENDTSNLNLNGGLGVSGRILLLPRGGQGKSSATLVQSSGVLGTEGSNPSLQDDSSVRLHNLLLLVETLTVNGDQTPAQVVNALLSFQPSAAAAVAGGARGGGGATPLSRTPVEYLATLIAAAAASGAKSALAVATSRGLAERGVTALGGEISQCDRMLQQLHDLGDDRGLQPAARRHPWSTGGSQAFEEMMQQQQQQQQGQHQELQSCKAQQLQKQHLQQQHYPQQLSQQQGFHSQQQQYQQPQPQHLHLVEGSLYQLQPQTQQQGLQVLHPMHPPPPPQLQHQMQLHQLYNRCSSRRQRVEY